MTLATPTFRFRQFALSDRNCGMKVGTDAVLLGAWASLPSVASDALPRIVDAGCGCGILALMMAQRLEGRCRVLAVDTDPGACRDAEDNFSASPWPQALFAQNADFTRTQLSATDLVISNPPYFARYGRHNDASVERRAARETSGTLDVASLIKTSALILKPDNGSLAFIAPCEQEEAVLFWGTLAHLHIGRRCEVSTVEGKAPKRTLWQLSRRPEEEEHSTLAIRHADGSYTRQYLTLTKSFYL